MVQYKSEEEVLRELGIEDWRHMTKDKVASFASNLHKMDPEVAKKALEQIPNFISFANTMVSHYKSVIDKVLEQNAKGSQEYYRMCNTIIVCLQNELSRGNLSFEQRQVIYNYMIELSDKVSCQVVEDRKYMLKVLRYFGLGIAAIASGIVAFLGLSSHFSDDDDEDDDSNDDVA